jgi:pyrimidine operon attenuation protein/uracil phosphoribosyltransferase
LIERDGRELPIQADIVGQTIELNQNQQIKLTNYSTLQLELKDNGSAT